MCQGVGHKDSVGSALIKPHCNSTLESIPNFMEEVVIITYMRTKAE